MKPLLPPYPSMAVLYDNYAATTATITTTSESHTTAAFNSNNTIHTTEPSIESNAALLLQPEPMMTPQPKFWCYHTRKYPCYASVVITTKTTAKEGAATLNNFRNIHDALDLTAEIFAKKWAKKQMLRPVNKDEASATLMIIDATYKTGNNYPSYPM